MRQTLQVPAAAGDEEIKRTALANPAVNRHIGDKQVRKTIVVPKRLVNIVVA